MRLQKTYTSERDSKKDSDKSNRNQGYQSFVHSASRLKLNEQVRSASNNRMAGAQSMLSRTKHVLIRLTDTVQDHSFLTNNSAKHQHYPDWKAKLFTKSSVESLDLNEKAKQLTKQVNQSMHPHSSFALLTDLPTSFVDTRLD
jgi:hypothetical protein